jgi:hypothetical protein
MSREPMAAKILHLHLLVPMLPVQMVPIFSFHASMMQIPTINNSESSLSYFPPSSFSPKPIVTALHGCACRLGCTPESYYRSQRPALVSDPVLPFASFHFGWRSQCTQLTSICGQMKQNDSWSYAQRSRNDTSLCCCASFPKRYAEPSFIVRSIHAGKGDCDLFF